eukprot:8788684-Pyramimonas_sp.AAC.1
MTQTAGEMAHCAWMASFASGTLPKPMPLATGDPCVPIPGLANEPPAPDPTTSSQVGDPYGEAYEGLFNQLLLLINDYPGAWASWESDEKKELFQPTI